MKDARQILQLNVKIGPASREAAKGLPIAQMYGDKLISGSDLRIRLQQCLLNLVDRHFASHIR